MTALLTRLRDAKEGSRELNNLIAPLAGWHRVAPQFTSNRKGGWISPENWLGADANGQPRLDGLHGTTIWRDAPNFTRSLDAAMTLIPKGHSLSGLWEAVKESERPWWGCDVRRDEPRYAVFKCLGAQKAALALCIAALTAIEAGRAGK